MKRTIGRCSICGGEVQAHVGVWMSIQPPPPPACTQCGAQTADSVLPVIPMVPVAPAHSGPVGVVWPLELPVSLGMPMGNGVWRA